MRQVQYYGAVSAEETQEGYNLLSQDKQTGYLYNNYSKMQVETAI